ncbi:MAG: cbb3-type cytochrome oxidase assembly protein [Anaerolineae bacterium]|nr:MAG: cbb3-type cytochrome oxidase assembly protein [Anaerolineae bacterium]
MGWPGSAGDRPVCAGHGLFLLWAYRSRQFEDIEGVKYRMLDLEED